QFLGSCCGGKSKTESHYRSGQRMLARRILPLPIYADCPPHGLSYWTSENYNMAGVGRKSRASERPHLPAFPENASTPIRTRERTERVRPAGFRPPKMPSEPALTASDAAIKYRIVPPQ